MSSGTAPADPRVRNGLVHIMKNGAKIGIGTSDPNSPVKATSPTQAGGAGGTRGQV